MTRIIALIVLLIAIWMIVHVILTTTGFDPSFISRIMPQVIP